MNTMHELESSHKDALNPCLIGPIFKNHKFIDDRKIKKSYLKSLNYVVILFPFYKMYRLKMRNSYVSVNLLRREVV